MVAQFSTANSYPGQIVPVHPGPRRQYLSHWDPGIAATLMFGFPIQTKRIVRGRAKGGPQGISWAYYGKANALWQVVNCWRTLFAGRKWLRIVYSQKSGQD